MKDRQNYWETLVHGGKGNTNKRESSKARGNYSESADGEEERPDLMSHEID